MRTRTKLIALLCATGALLLLAYLVAEYADVVVVMAALAGAVTSIAFIVVALKATFRWIGTKAGRLRRELAAPTQEAPAMPDPPTEAVRPPSPASAKREADELLDEFIRDT
ncbi:MAG: hypothetical protein F4X47_08760 [Gammaproteobacteria bacterium]|nr:hypothetical protein [Gammaproteobacteria bacterium]MYC52394.1 hypothetical protein [Gammaproteobacteria bacterium]